MNKTTFFQYVRRLPFGGKLTENQVAGMEAILETCDEFMVKDLRHIAYILATAFHETGGKMVPVREGFAKSDSAARKVVAKYKYGKPDPVTGHVYYGRGHVQLTWAKNYKVMGELVGADLYNNPDLALDRDISAHILVEGMIRGESLKGDFTGKSLDQYFNGAVNDPIGARRIVNGTDKAQLIATYHKAFLDALEAAQEREVPEDVVPEAAEPDRPNLLTDKTTLGAAGGFIGMGGLSFLDNINSGYALFAFLFAVLAAVGVWAFCTGRLQIVRKGGV